MDEQTLRNICGIQPQAFSYRPPSIDIKYVVSVGSVVYSRYVLSLRAQSSLNAVTRARKDGGLISR